MTILLHACCAPCSAPILEKMLDDGLQPAVFYENSNIFPHEEYLKRRDEIEKHCHKLGIKFFKSDYNHQNWLDYVKGLEDEPERGRRCLNCFRFRLKKTAEFASINGFDTIASSLSSSRWKDLKQIDAAGFEAVEKFDALSYFAENWRKNGLQNRRNQLIKENNFYNQLWCGCEFSHKPDDKII